MDALFHMLYGREAFLYDRKYRDFCYGSATKQSCLHLFRERYTDWTGDGEWKRKRRESAGNSRYLVLPVPVTKIERNHDVNLILKEELTREKERDWMLFGGIFGPEWRQQL